MLSQRIFVNGRFLTQPLTGIQRFAYEITLRLPHATIVSPNHPSPEYSRLPHGQIAIARSKLPHHLWEQMVLPAQVPRDALLWCPSGSGPVRGSKREIITIHDMSIYDTPEGFNAPYRTAYKALYTVLPRRVRRILTVSEFSKARIIDLLRVEERRVGVVPNAAASVFMPQEFGVVDIALRELGVTRPYVMSLGAVSARKNFARLLQAWRHLSLEWPEHRLVVVGQGGLGFSDKRSLGKLPERTIWLEAVTDTNLAALYSGADVMAFPSLYEGFGLPVLEAMACGTPVLTSNSSALPEVAGAAAYLVDPRSTEAIAYGLSELLSNPSLREQLRLRGLARAAQFRWSDSAEEFLRQLDM